ncbi:MAG: C40 family peptidase [Rhodoferax sp.]
MAFIAESVLPPRSHPRIALAWALVAVALLAGCSSAPKRSEAPLHASTPMASRVSDEQARDVTLHAISLVGTRYRRGGNTPDTGFDCSGLIGYVYRNSAGVLAPRTVAQLSDWGQAVDGDTLRSGDLVVFTLGGVTSHAGIYVGDGRFVHAPSTGGDVRLDTLTAGYWSRQAVAFRRP